jgi:hypothetical protein
MEMSYYDKLRQISTVVEKYKNLELADFIRMTLIECGFDETLMNNVYIGEDVNYPNSFGCYKEDDKIIAYFLNDQGAKRIKEYRNMTEFMIMFVRTAPLSEKYESARKAL